MTRTLLKSMIDCVKCSNTIYIYILFHNAHARLYWFIHNIFPPFHVFFSLRTNETNVWYGRNYMAYEYAVPSVHTKIYTHQTVKYYILSELLNVVSVTDNHTHYLLCFSYSYVMFNVQQKLFYIT